ncbi:MAG: hypothetical protein AAF829_04245 [Pseudomonadota bacterium]
MKTHIVAIGLASSLLVSGCATKRYPIATPLSGTEAALLDCRELELELARTEETQATIADTAGTDWRSAAGFLGDFGIGNAMAKSEAEEALAERRTSILTARAEKGC